MCFKLKGLGCNRKAKKRESSTCPIWVKLGSAVQGLTLKLWPRLHPKSKYCSYSTLIGWEQFRYFNFFLSLFFFSRWEQFQYLNFFGLTLLTGWHLEIFGWEQLKNHPVCNLTLRTFRGAPVKKNTLYLKKTSSNKEKKWSDLGETLLNCSGIRPEALT